MPNNKLIEFIDEDESFQDELTPEQLAAVRTWALPIESIHHQKGYLECLKEFCGKRLQIYLKNLIPGYPESND